MKKIIFGSASAILAVVGFSAFKSAKTTTTTYYWFSVDGTEVNVGEKALTFTNSGTNAVAFANTISSTLNPLNAACSQDDVHQCLIGFTASKIVTISSQRFIKTSSKVTGAPASLAANTVPTGFKYTKD